VDHGADDNVRVDDDQVEGWTVRFHELPCCCFGPCLRHVISEDGVVSLDGLLGGYLSVVKYMLYIQWGCGVYWIPVLLGIRPSFLGHILERVEHGDGTAE
jgi:hypothetical protein